MDVALVARQCRQPSAQIRDVHADVMAGQRGESVGSYHLGKPEMLLQKRLDAATSSTLSDTADAVTFTGSHLRGSSDIRRANLVRMASRRRRYGDDME